MHDIHNLIRWQRNEVSACPLVLCSINCGNIQLLSLKLVLPLSFARFELRGRLHGELSTPGLNSALLTGLNFFAIKWTISTPGLKRYTIRSRHRFLEVKKAFILFSCNK
jgi:hypothetical protein